MDWSKNLLELLKLTPRNTAPLLIVSSILLFGSDELLKTIGMLQLTKDYRIIIGAVFMLSLAILVTHIAFELFAKINKRWRRRKVYTKIKKRLNALTEDEKQILRYYISQNTRANTLRYDDGVVQGLRSAGIIYQSSSLGTALEGFSYNIIEFAWDYLHVYPHLLDGHTDIARTDKRTNSWGI